MAQAFIAEEPDEPGVANQQFLEDIKGYPLDELEERYEDAVDHLRRHPPGDQYHLDALFVKNAYEQELAGRIRLQPIRAAPPSPKPLKPIVREPSPILRGAGMADMLNGRGMAHLHHALGQKMEQMGGPHWHGFGTWRAGFHGGLMALRAAHALAPLHGAALHRAIEHLEPAIRSRAMQHFASCVSSGIAKARGGALKKSQQIKILADRAAWVKEHPQNLHLRPQYVRQGHTGRFRKLPKKLTTLLTTAGLGVHQARHMLGGAPLPMALPQGSQARLEQLSAPPNPESSGVILYNYGGKNLGAGANVHGGRMLAGAKRRH